MSLLRPERPVSASTVEVARTMAAAAGECQVAFMIVGATARDILLENVHGIRTGRATRDIDFACAVEDWPRFERLKNQLCASGRIDPDPVAVQWLFYRTSVDNEPARRIPIDLIPFVPIAGREERIAWPPDMRVMMNVAGFEPAMQSSLLVEITPGLGIPVASLPGLALLKLLAWLDRGNEHRRDAADLVLLLHTYADAGNLDRIYGEHIDVLEAHGYDPSLAGACLLGMDASRIASTTVLERALAALEDRQTCDRLATALGPSLPAQDAPFAAAMRLLEIFRSGLARAGSRIRRNGGSPSPPVE